MEDKTFSTFEVTIIIEMSESTTQDEEDEIRNKKYSAFEMSKYKQNKYLSKRNCRW